MDSTEEEVDVCSRNSLVASKSNLQSAHLQNDQHRLQQQDDLQHTCDLNSSRNTFNAQCNTRQSDSATCSLNLHQICFKQFKSSDSMAVNQKNTDEEFFVDFSDTEGIQKVLRKKQTSIKPIKNVYSQIIQKSLNEEISAVKSSNSKHQENTEVNDSGHFSLERQNSHGFEPLFDEKEIFQRPLRQHLNKRKLSDLNKDSTFKDSTSDFEQAPQKFSPIKDVIHKVQTLEDAAKACQDVNINNDANETTDHLYDSDGSKHQHQVNWDAFKHQIDASDPTELTERNEEN